MREALINCVGKEVEMREKSAEESGHLLGEIPRRRGGLNTRP